ncbi:hypothetical protein EON65_52450 [archaeon]|nr:MAG: hypothetical protein EON65_52450 [archaeon]
MIPWLPMPPYRLVEPGRPQNCAERQVTFYWIHIPGNSQYLIYRLTHYKQSFEDLQKLWYVLYKERNLLLTSKMRARRALNPPTPDDEARYMKVKRSMAAIKHVIGERRRIDALIKAQEAGQQGESSKTEKK